MNTLGFFIITMVSGEVLQTTTPVDCATWFAMLDNHPRIEMMQCEYTSAPTESLIPVPRPEDGE